MVGKRFLRQRRASLRSLAAAVIAEPLESRRLLAAVYDDSPTEDVLAEATLAESVSSCEEYNVEACIVEEACDPGIGEEGGLIEVAVETESGFEDGNRPEDFPPILAVCGLPSNRLLSPYDGDSDWQSAEFVYETQDLEFTEEANDPEFMESALPEESLEDFNEGWVIDWTTVRGINGDAEFVPGELPERTDFSDWQVFQTDDGFDESAWCGLVDVNTGTDGVLLSDDVVGEEVQERDWSEYKQQLLLAGNEFDAQFMMFSVPLEDTPPAVLSADSPFAPVNSLRGGSGMMLRTLSISVPVELSPSSIQSVQANFFPQQRRGESVFGARSGSFTGSADPGAAVAGLVLARTETRGAVSTVVPSASAKRSVTAYAAQAPATSEPGSEITEDAQSQLNLFGDDRSPKDRKPVRKEQSRADQSADQMNPDAADAGTVRNPPVSDRAAEQADSRTTSEPVTVADSAQRQLLSR